MDRRSGPVVGAAVLAPLLLVVVYLLLCAAPRGVSAQQPPGVDLDVTYIGREPTYHRYCVEYPGGVPRLCSGTENEQRWPAPGEVVTFTAHVVNKGTQASPPFSCTWYIDGTPVHTSTLPALTAGAEVTATYAWTWAHGLDGERLLFTHTVRFTADPQNAISETFETNNSRQDRTDGLSLAIFFDRQLYDELDHALNGAGTYSAEDWLQWQIAQMNQRLAQAVYPTSPQGVLSRVRVDYIQVCDDVQACKDAHDWLAQDGRWQFLYTSDYVSRFATQIDWGLIHELGHQLGLIDLYRMNVEDWMNLVPDGSGDPLLGAIYWSCPGRMGGGSTVPYCDTTYFSSHSAAGLNSHHGYRRGYYGEYLFDIPLTTTLVILDRAGSPVEGATVELFQKAESPEEIPPTPAIVGQTDGQGRFTLPDRPAQGHTTTRTGHTLRDTPFGRISVVGTTGIFLVRVRARGHEEFFRYDITDANLACWSGITGTHLITLTTHIPHPGAPGPPPTLRAERVEGGQVTLVWSASPSSTVVGYTVYRAARPDWAYRPITTTAALSYTDTLTGYGKYHYAVAAVDGVGRESGFSPTARGLYLERPWGVGITPQGDRVIAENHYRRLLLQRADGRYVGFFNRRVNFTGQGLDVDARGDILVAEPARHCVHHLDAGGNRLGTIGDCGGSSGPLEAPSDVAFANIPPLPPDRPLGADGHTLLLCSFDGDTTCADGEVGAGTGIAFTEGRFGQGVLVSGTATLVYPTAGNITATQGTVEFWVQPAWDGDDGQDHAFVETSGGWYNRLRVAKDGANNLRFFLWDGKREYSLGYSVAHWHAGEWHHVAAVWTADRMWLLVDGEIVAERESSPPQMLGEDLYVGSNQGGGQQADGVLDDLRISDLPRFVWDPYAFVVDAGNHRLLAVDRSYQVIASCGGLGTGPGEFSSPRGVAVTLDGRVVVADTDNDRLQVFTFEGGQFNHQRTITASLDGPYDVDTDLLGRIVVADTGNDLVRLLGADGEVLLTFDRPDAPYSGPFDDPRGVAGDRQGRIVVADTGHRRVVTVALELNRLFVPLALRGGP